MDYLHRILLKNSYAEWGIKSLERKPTTSTKNSDTGLEVNKNIFISVPYVPGLSEEFSHIPVYRSFSKEPTPLNPSLCTPKIKSHHTLNKALSTNSPVQMKTATSPT